MLTQEQVLDAVKGGRKSACAVLDARDYGRLVAFFPVEDWHHFGMKLADGADPNTEVRPWTEDELKKQLTSDVAFGFEKALDQRGLSSGLMYEVVKMWMWVFEDDLQHHDDYAQYGLPLFKAVAVKYGLPNPIDNDNGDEWKYSSEGAYADVD